MKRLRYILVIGCLLMASLSGCYRNNLNYSGDIYTEENMNKFSMEKQTVEELTSIDITAVYSKVEIIASDEFSVEYSYYYISNEPIYKIEDGKLTFNDKEINVGTYSIRQKEDNYIKIYVPASADFESVSISKSSGDCSLTGFKAGKVILENSYGDINLASSDIDELEIISSSGKVDLKNIIVDSGNIENAYGRITLNNINADSQLNKETKFSIVSSSGTIQLSNNVLGLADIKNSYGDVMVQDSIIYEASAFMSSGAITIKDSDISELYVENSYGNINAQLSGKMEDYVIDVTTSYSKAIIDGREYDRGVLIDRGGSRHITVEAQSGSVKLSFEN